MADAKITIHGDSSEAVEALSTATDASENLTDAVDGLSESAEKISESSEKSATALGRLSTASQSASSQARSAGTALDGLGSALSKISPEASAAASVLGTFTRGATSLASVLNPVTLAIAAATVTVGLFTRAQQAQKKAAEESAAALADLTARAVDSAKALRDAELSAGGAASGFLSLAQGSREASEALAAYYDDLVADDAFAAFNAAAAAHDEAIVRNEQAIESLAAANQRFAASQREVARLQQIAAGSSTAARGVARDLQRAETELASARAILTARSNEAELAQRKLNDSMREFGAVSAAAEAVGYDFERLRSTAERTGATVTRTASEIADGLVHAGVVARDLGDALSRIGSGDVGRELVSTLSGVGDETLRALGATESQIERLRDLALEQATGAERLKLAQDGVTAALSAQAALSESLVEAEREAQRVAYARQALEVELATEAARQRDEQRAWLEEVSRSYEEQLAFEEQLRESAFARLTEGAQLSSDERAAVEAHYELIRAGQEEQIARAQELSASLQEGAAGLINSGLTDVIGGLAGALGEAAASGDSFGKAMGGSAKKAVAAIAKQFGSLFLATGLGMVFMPGMQAQGAGLIGAGVALLAIGGAVGAAGKKKGQNESSGGGGGGSATVVVDTYERESPGGRARDVGAAESNADRYGINRDRAWA